MWELEVRKQPQPPRGAKKLNKVIIKLDISKHVGSGSQMLLPRKVEVIPSSANQRSHNIYAPIYPCQQQTPKHERQ